MKSLLSAGTRLTFAAGALAFACILSLSSCGSGGEKPATGAADSSAAGETIDTRAQNSSEGVGRFAGYQAGAPDTSNLTKAREIFNGKCAACHKLSADKFVGPGLRGITQRRTPGFILNMITNPEGMLKEDALAKQLLKEHMVPMTFQNVTDDDAKLLFELLRHNDTQ